MNRFRLGAALAASICVAIAGCGRGGDGETDIAQPDAEQTAQAINATRFSNATAAARRDEATYAPSILKLQILLDRARFSPGVIDGRFNANTRKALRAFERANGLREDGVLDQEAWNRLTGADQDPVMQLHSIDPGEVVGPYIDNLPDSFQGMTRLSSLGYRGAAEALSEAFHMDEGLLRDLNPDADFRQAGTTIVVAQRGGDDLGVDIALVVVDSVEGMVLAYGGDQRLLASYPATVGSERRPAPAGRMEVRVVEPQPTYAVATDRVAFGGGMTRRPQEIAPGPNNPVGSVWIELSPGAYGLHGSPDPESVGEPAAYGGVRLTNWDARELARGVRVGVPVVFR